jgi:hypothetical protein
MSPKDQAPELPWSWWASRALLAAIAPSILTVGATLCDIL